MARDRGDVVVGDAGVASVALALAIPLETEGGAPFPDRDEIVFIAFGVIMATLVLQGLTLPWLVRRLGVQADEGAEKEFEKALAVRAAKAAKRRLKEIEEVEELPEEMSERLLRRAFEIGVRISPEVGEDERREGHEQRVRRLRRMRRIQGEMLSAARHEVLAARSEPGRIPRWWIGCCGTWMCVVCGEVRVGGGARRGVSHPRTARYSLAAKCGSPAGVDRRWRL